MFPLMTTKLAVNIVSALGVSKVIGDIIKNNVTIVTTSQKVLVSAGGFVLSSMVVDHAVTHVNKMVDDVAGMFNKNGVPVDMDSDLPDDDGMEIIH